MWHLRFSPTMKAVVTFCGYIALYFTFLALWYIDTTSNVPRIIGSKINRDAKYFRGRPTRFTHAVDCRAIINGDEIEIEKGLRITNAFLPTDDNVSQTAKNCSFFKNRGYITKPVSEKEESFPIAYSILMYKDVTQVEFLLRMIYRPQNLYCIHIDKHASAEVFQQMSMIVKCFHNVFIASEPVTIVYAGFSRLMADINCMKDLLPHRQTWKYLINLSGQMYPLKSNEEIVRILEIYNGANDIEFVSVGRFKERYNTKYVENITNSRRDLLQLDEKNPSLPYGLKYVKGSAYGIFSREYVRFILEDQKAAALLEWSKYTYSPDEMFWSTLHHIGFNPQLKTPGGYNGTELSRHPWLATHAAWCGSDPCYSGKCVHGICIPGLKDLHALDQRREFTVNKLMIDFQQAAGICLAERIWNKTFSTLNETHFDYYRNLPFILPKD